MAHYVCEYIYIDTYIKEKGGPYSSNKNHGKSKIVI